MEIIFVRHAEPDYILADEYKMNQIEKNFAPLTKEGRLAAKELQTHHEFLDADLIVSSPYTRALHTASIINQSLELDLEIEFNLREWLADKEGGYISLKERDRRWEEYRSDEVVLNPPYESASELVERTRKVLNQYKDYKKVIVVCHFNVIEAIVGKMEEVLPFAGTISYQYI